MCSYRHAKLDIAMLITMRSRLTDSLMMGSRESNNSVRLSIHHTFNIWEVAAKVRRATSNRPQRLQEIFRMPCKRMNSEKIDVWTSILPPCSLAKLWSWSIFQANSLSVEMVQEDNSTNVFAEGQQIKLFRDILLGSMDVPSQQDIQEISTCEISLSLACLACFFYNHGQKKG